MQQETITIALAAELLRFEQDMRRKGKRERQMALKKLAQSRPDFHRAYIAFHSLLLGAAATDQWRRKTSEEYMRAWADMMAPREDAEEREPARNAI